LTERELSGLGFHGESPLELRVGLSRACSAAETLDAALR
jgi:hypothetical protein